MSHDTDDCPVTPELPLLSVVPAGHDLMDRASISWVGALSFVDVNISIDVARSDVSLLQRDEVLENFLIDHEIALIVFPDCFWHHLL